jgi:hypothetical protein
MSSTKQDITDQVQLCTECHKGFVIGEGGEGKVCDACRDIKIHNSAWGLQSEEAFEITEQESDA